MSVSAIARAAWAMPFLWLASIIGLLASGSSDTCTGGAADAYALGVIVLILNAIGMIILARGTHLGWLAATVTVPLVAAIVYSIFAVRLAIGVLHGLTACTILLGEPFPIADGSEIQFAWQWLGAGTVFWLGLMVTLRNSMRQRRIANDKD